VRDVDATATSLTTGSGNIFFDQMGAGDATVVFAQAANGSVFLTSDASSLTAVDVSASNHVVINSGNDAIVDTIVEAGGNVDITADRDIVVNGEALVDAGYVVTFDAGRDVVAGGESVVSAGEALVVEAVNDVSLDDDAVFAAGVTTDVTAGEDMLLGEYARVFAGDETRVTVGRDLTMGSDSAIWAGSLYDWVTKDYYYGYGGDVWVTVGEDLVMGTDSAIWAGNPYWYGKSSPYTSNVWVTVGNDMLMGEDAMVWAGGSYYDKQYDGAYGGNVWITVGNDLVMDDGAAIVALPGYYYDGGDDSKENGFGGLLEVTVGNDILMGEYSEMYGDTVLVTAGGDLVMNSDSAIVAESLVDITAARAAIELVQAGEPGYYDEYGVSGGEASITATEGSITVNDDDDSPDVLASLVTLTAVTGIGHNPIPGGVTASVDVAGAEVVNALTTGDNGRIDLDLFNDEDVTLWARTLGEDADILVDSSLYAQYYDDEYDYGYGPVPSLFMDYVATQNGDIVANANSAVVMNHVWALDDGIIDPQDPTEYVPSSNGSGISSLPDNNGITGAIDDAHYISITTNGVDADVILGTPDMHGGVTGDVWADYYLTVVTQGPGSDIGVGTGAIHVCGDVVLTAAQGSIYDAGNTDETDIFTCGDLTLWVGNRIGEADAADPLDVEVGGHLNVGAVNNSPYFEHHRRVWAFLRGTSGDLGVHYLGGPSDEPPGAIIWNTAAWGGPETVMRRIDAAEGGWSREAMAFVDQVQGDVWGWQFLYFPHVWAMLDAVPAVFNIEYILHGGGTIEGLPEGVGPSEININDIDDTFTFNF